MRSGDHIDHYRLIDTIGSGTFGTVWLAHDELLDDQVAIKVLADNWARDADFRRRFIDEAKIMRRLDHQRVVRVFSVGEVPSGQPMFIMSFADGGTLEDRLRDAAGESRRLDIGTVVALMSDLLDALSVVHDFGPTAQPGEFVFVERAPEADEDDGWALGYVYDKASDSSDLVILDAANPQADPVARVHLPRRVPHGFHGSWIRDAD